MDLIYVDVNDYLYYSLLTIEAERIIVDFKNQKIRIFHKYTNLYCFIRI